MEIPGIAWFGKGSTGKRDFLISFGSGQSVFINACLTASIPWLICKSLKSELYTDAISTGSVPFLPPMPGIEKPNILTPTEIFNGRRPEKRKTVVVGGGPTGCEVAHHLSKNGCPVIIVELLPKIAGQLESITRKVLLGKLKANNVQMMTENKVSRIEEEGVVVMGTDEKELFIEAETVVMAVGNKPVDGLYKKIKAKGITSYQIGDCLEPRSAKAAIYEGAVIGRTI